MNKCPYKTMEYCYGFTCIRCHCVWFYPHDVDPMVCSKCEEELELEIQLEAARVRMKAYRDTYELRLKEFYYGPLQEQLNQETPLLKLGDNKQTKDLFKPQKIKRNRFWKR